METIEPTVLNSSRPRKFLREFIAFLYYFTGIHYLLMKSFGRKKATILVYHDPTPVILREHLKYLSRSYRFISLSTLVEAIRNRDASAIPPNALVLTFDDGHKGNHALLELFQEYQVTPTISLCSGIVNTHRHFWWKNGAIDVARLKKMACEEMFRQLRLDTGFAPDKEYPDRQALSLDELRAMSPFVEFGSHTGFHPVLTNCDDERCLHELADSKTFLEELLQRQIEHFVYPNGDYGEREIRLLKTCGYRSGRTLDIGRNGIESDPCRLKAIGIEDDASINILRAQVSGFFCYLKYSRHGSFLGARPPLL